MLSCCSDVMLSEWSNTNTTSNSMILLQSEKEKQGEIISFLQCLLQTAGVGGRGAGPCREQVDISQEPALCQNIPAHLLLMSGLCQSTELEAEAHEMQLPQLTVLGACAPYPRDSTIRNPCATPPSSALSHQGVECPWLSRLSIGREQQKEIQRQFNGDTH